MKNLNGKITNKSSETNGQIKEERLKTLKGNYQAPETSEFIYSKRNDSECSDMASCTLGAGYHEPGCNCGRLDIS